MEEMKKQERIIAAYGSRGMSKGQTVSLTDFTLGSCRSGLQ
jgi:hypothetical protein